MTTGSGPLFVLLFLLGTARCVASLRTWGLALTILPLVVCSQLLIYAALDGPLFRYRVPTQPLITLIAAAGFTYLVTAIARWRDWSWHGSREVLPTTVGNSLR